jgi:hypothetical protein
MDMTDDEQVGARADWVPLEQMLRPEVCERFMFIGRTREICLYKHIHTRRYLNIAPDGGCFQYTPAGYVPIDREEAIKRAFS